MLNYIYEDSCFFYYIMKEIRKYSLPFKSILKEVKGKMKTNSKQIKGNTSC